MARFQLKRNTITADLIAGTTTALVNILHIYGSLHFAGAALLSQTSNASMENSEEIDSTV